MDLHKTRISFLLLTLGALCLSTENPSTTKHLFAAEAAFGQWKEMGSLNVKRRHHAMVALPNGRVLAIGGMTLEREQGRAVQRMTDTCELYDPTSGKWTPTGRMNHEYGSSTAVRLQNGKVLVIARGENPYTQCEVYDPETRKWTSTGSLIGPRSEPVNATVLTDGKVLLAGGWTGSKALSSCELYDPVAGTWRRTGAMHHPRAWHQVVRLGNGRVLAVAGDSSHKSCEIYDPETEKWSLTAPLKEQRQRFLAVSLRSGNVLVTGGDLEYGGPGPIESSPVTSSEMYTPAAGSWTNAARLPVPYTTLDSTANVLPNGDVVLVGGIQSSGCHRYDVLTDTWKVLPAPMHPRCHHAAVVLPDGGLMIAGGYKGGPDIVEATLTSCEVLRHDR